MKQLKRSHFYLGCFLVAGILAVLVLFFFLNLNPADKTTSQLISGQNDLPADLDYQSVEEIYDLIRNHFDGPLSQEDLITGIKKGLVSATGDPYSEYLDADESAAFDEFLSGQFEGVGIEITISDGFLTVIAPIEGSPAYDAGIKPQDIILEINGQSTSRMSIGEAVQLIRGPAGTTVELQIHREGSEPDVISITRDLIDLPPVSWRFEDGVGIIRISNFSSGTANYLAEAASEILAENPAGIVLDLRSNPGGSTVEAIAVAGFWLEKNQSVVEYRVAGQVVEIGRVGEVPDLDFDQPVFASQPTVVLIDSNSASASEIVAGALQDHGRATLVGQQSFGKGRVQNLIRLGRQTLKLTVSHFYTPYGRPIDSVGLKPDFVVDNSETETGEVVDEQLTKAKTLINQAEND